MQENIIIDWGAATATADWLKEEDGEEDEKEEYGLEKKLDAEYVATH